MKNRIGKMTTMLTLCTVMIAGCGNQESLAITEADISETKSVLSTENAVSGVDAGGVASETVASEMVDTVKTDDVHVPRMLCIDGEIYYDTGRISDALRCGVMDWIIDSSVPAGEIPAENMQSNFGTEYGCQRWTKGQVHVNIDGTWHIFQTSDVYRLKVTNGNNGEEIELERGPAFWEIIEKCQNLDVTALNAEVDSVGYPYCLRLYDEENNLLATMNHVGRKLNVDGEFYEDNGYGTVNELYLVLDALFEEDFPLATATERVRSSEQNVVQGKNEKAERIDELEDVTMSVTYATEKGANLVLMNFSDKNMQCGEDYELHRLKDGEWYKSDYIIDNWAFAAIAYMMPQNQPVSIFIDWTHFHGTLPHGQYRIVKTVTDFRGTGDYTDYKLAAEFEVK